MLSNCDRIGALVMRVQNEFLATSDLTLTVHEAQRRFAIDESGCEAVLNALAEANVLAKTEHGAYVAVVPPIGGTHERDGPQAGAATGQSDAGVNATRRLMNAERLSPVPR